MPNPNSGRLPKQSSSRSSSEKKIIKPSQQTQQKNQTVRDALSYGIPSYYDQSVSSVPAAPSVSTTPKFNPVDLLLDVTNSWRDRMGESERQTEIAQSQNPMTTAANRQSDKKAEEKRMNSLGKEAEAAYKPNEEQERFAEDARRYSAERNAAREREAAAEKKSEVPATPFRSDKPAPGVVKPSQQIEQGTDAGTGNGNVYTNRHNELQRELDQITQYEGYITDPDEANRTAARKREIIEELNQIDQTVGSQPRYYDEPSRLLGIGKSWAHEQAGAYSNALGTVASLAGEQDELGRAIADSDIAGYVTDPLAESIAREAAANGQLESNGTLATNQAIVDATQSFSDAERAKSVEEMAKVKAGLDGFESFMVDAVKGALDLSSDAIINMLVPGGGLAAMGTRTFGMGAAEQRDKGGSVNAQLLAGLKSAGIEILTEKIGGPFEKVYGKTFVGKAVNEAIDKVRTTPIGKRLISLASDFMSEGAEEILSDILNITADRLTGLDPESGMSVSEILYDGLIGGFLGLAGGGFNQLSPGARYQAAEQIVDSAISLQQQNEQAQAPAVEEQRQQQTPADMLVEAATPKAEEARQTSGEERAEGQAPTAPKTPADILAEQGTPKPAEASESAEAQEGPSEAAESKIAEGDESVPEGTPKATSEAPAELNNEPTTTDSQETSVQDAHVSGTIEEQRYAEHKRRSENHMLAREVEEANRALKEIERFNQDPEYRTVAYSDAEVAQGAVDMATDDLKEAGLTRATDLRDRAQELRNRSKEAQRMVDKIEASTPEGEDITDPDYNYWYDEVDAAENEAYALDEIADFIEANPDAFAEDLDVEQGGTESEQIGDGEDRGDSPVDSNAGTDAQDSRGERKDDSRRDGEMVGGKSTKNLESQADYDAAKDRRDQVKRRFDRGQAFVESEIELDGGEVIDIKNAPGWIKRAVEKAQKEAPDCRFVIATKTAQIAYYSHGNGTIVLNPGRLQNWALSITKKTGVPHSAANAVLHERVHYWFERSDYNASEILKYIQSDFAYDVGVQQALRDAYEAHKADYHADVASESANVEEMQNALWEEVIADLAADLPRAFVNDGKVNPAYDRIRASAMKYVQNYVVPSYRVNNGIDLYNGKPATGGTAAPSNPDGGNDPGASKSWADSLMAQEAPPENTEVEQPDDDMTPLNDMDRERDEERREKQKEETKKHFGTENHKRMTKALERFEKWRKSYNERYGKESRDEHGGIIEDEDGNAIKTSALDNFAENLRLTLEGEQTIQSFQEYYESLRSEEGESNATDENYLYDPAIAEALNQLANAERDLIYAEKGGPANAEKAVQYGEGMSTEVAKENFDKQTEAFSRVLETRMGLLEGNFKKKTSFNKEVTQNSKREKAGLKNWAKRLADKFWKSQFRPDTFFKSLVNYSGKATVANELAQRSADSEKKQTNVRYSAREFFHDLTTNPETAKAWAEIESGKTKGNVEIPGLGKKVSLNYELAILKTLETNGALDHIARFGAQFVNEADYIKGLNNNGRGETESYQEVNRLTREALDQWAKDNLQAANERAGGKPKKITGKDIYNEKIRILKELRSNLKSDVFSNDVAHAAYDASVEAMRYLADEINGVTLRMYGLAKALQGSNYWPMQVIGRKNNLQFVNNTAFQMEDASFLQHRKGGSGALQINPFAEVMSSYIDRASRFVGFGELNSDLMMMSKEIGVGHGEHDAEKQSIQSVIQKQAGKSAAEWMERYMKTLNGTAEQPNAVGSILRGSLASSALSLNPGVALKQSPSYFNAAGIVDLDILIKNRLVNFGALRTAKSYEGNPLLQAINERTKILESRKSGTVALGEQDGRALFGKLKKKLPDWITNRDVSTVSNLALACAEQVKRNNPGIDTNSDEFFQKTADLLEEATVKTQPIYDAEFRADYLRSKSDLVRTLAMFRTQQTQNLNNLVQAFGEAAAAKREGGDTKAANAKRNQVVAGYAMSQVAFALLSSAAKMLTHKTKDYEDEDGQFDFGKLAKRLGLDFLTTGAGVVWFGDTIAKVAIDAATGLYAKLSKDEKDKGTSEFMEMSDNTLSVIDDLIASTIKVFSNQTAKNVKSEVFNLAQATGLPARNFYNIINSAIMYGYDATHKNPANYDDAVDMWQTQSGLSDSTRAKQTTNAAIKEFGRGNAKKAEALLATLDYSSKDVVAAAKKAAGDAYVMGDIDEKTYRRILQNVYDSEAEIKKQEAKAALDAGEIDGRTYSEAFKDATQDSTAEIDKIVHNKELDRIIGNLIQSDPKTYEGIGEQIEAAKENAIHGTSKSEAAARLILDAAMSKNGQAAFLERYTSAGYFKAYEAAAKVLPANKIVDMLAGIDTNKDDSFTQEELYNHFLDHPGDSAIVKFIWNTNNWSKSWDEYKSEKSKRVGYDKLARDNSADTEFGEAEKQLKALKSGSTYTIQNGGGDPAMFKIIDGMGLSDKDADTVVDRYVSPANKANYHTVRDAGYTPSESFRLLTAVDTDGKGTLSQKEMWAYYMAHQNDEAVIEALWNAQGYTGKKTRDWATYKKNNH